MSLQYREKSMQEYLVTEPYLTPKTLAIRWKITPHTLGQWRWKGHGPRFFKIGRCVRYLKKEIERCEDHITQSTITNVKDECFLSIDLGFLSSKSIEEVTGEETTMDP